MKIPTESFVCPLLFVKFSLANESIPLQYGERFTLPSGPDQTHQPELTEAGGGAGSLRGGSFLGFGWFRKGHGGQWAEQRLEATGRDWSQRRRQSRQMARLRGGQE